MRELTEDVMERLLEEYGRVIYAALRDSRVYQSNQQYEDYYQIGCLKLFEAYQACAKDPLQEENRYQFVNFAGQRIKWAIIDEFRRAQYLKDHETLDGDKRPEEDIWESDFQGEVALKELLTELLDRLTEKEQSFLVDRLYFDLNMSEIAKKRKVSRKTVHVWRKRIQEKVMSCWEGYYL